MFLAFQKCIKILCKCVYLHLQVLYTNNLKTIADHPELLLGFKKLGEVLEGICEKRFDDAILAYWIYRKISPWTPNRKKWDHFPDTTSPLLPSRAALYISEIIILHISPGSVFKRWKFLCFVSVPLITFI